ncbi:FMN-dependent NADH-azoreductase [Chitinimonas sp.]|uniref:FMN-dependent NADH-azoreductase n=1 Tax=Chitinimonas sp. TaxID=1934313 RepID=UPI0035B41F9E
MKVLHLDSSILGDASASRQLGNEVVAALRSRHSGIELNYRDLAADSISHLAGSTLAANGTPAELRTIAQQHEAALSEQVLNEFLQADVLVIGAPMYNFAIPSQLRAWIDRIVVAGKTFKYGANGPEGLVADKQVFIVSTAGGKHAGSPSAAAHEDYLKAVLNFVGIRSITVIHAQGLAMGAETRDAAFAAARVQIAALTAAQAA